MKRETLGKIALDLIAKDEPRHSVIDMQREMQKDYEKNFYECLDSGKKECDGDFFIVVLTKTERLLKNVIRNYFFFRKSCPTPTYDNAIYMYHRKEDRIEFLWVIPSKETCEAFRDDPLATPEEEKELLNYIYDFYEGTLDIKAKKLNGEPLISLY